MLFPLASISPENRIESEEQETDGPAAAPAVMDCRGVTP
jgi:hypothetical protein